MMQNFEDKPIIIDKGTFDDTSCFTEGKVTPAIMLSFAKEVLLVLAVMFELGCVFEFFMPGSKVYETCKVTLPSLATLVIGYYFGSNKSQM